MLTNTLHEILNSTPISTSFFEHFFINTDNSLLITDLEGTIIDVNPAFTLSTGYTKEEALGKAPRILRSGYHSDTFYKNLWETIVNKGHWEDRIWNRRKDGYIYPQHLTIDRICDPATKKCYFLAIFADIQSLEEKDESLNLAYYDPLTKLANRFLLQEHLKKIAQGIDRDSFLKSKSQNPAFVEKELALFFMDLNHFKEINDTYGHHAGDQLLIHASQKMLGNIRKMDLLARHGGDEFVLAALINRNKADAAQIASRLVHAVQEPLKIHNQTIIADISIGISLYPSYADNINTLIQQADKAMYQAKQSDLKEKYLFYTKEMG